MNMSERSMRIGADIGGTFTDVVTFDRLNSRLRFGKTLSTPANLVSAIADGVHKAQSTFREAELFFHGSTVAINTIIERTGAKAALLTTRGFRDVYEIGRINRPDAYNLFFQKHVPLIRRSLRLEVKERINSQGIVIHPLDESELHEIARHIMREGIEAVAILFLHSYMNPVHERRAKDIIAASCPGIFVTASHELSQEYREFERTSTVAANAYVGPRMSGYIDAITQFLKGDRFSGSFLIVQSSGGLLDAVDARSQCVRMLESGPAAGVIGAQALCAQIGINNAIAFDMGGTTAKAGVIHQGEALTSGGAIIGGYAEGLPIQVPMIHIQEVGTGGGSIARVGAGKSLRVGPQSAGAEPGPACYGRGGLEPTVTDANLILGRIDANHFLGGEMRLNIDHAQNALESKVANPLGLELAGAADGILRIAVTTMSHAVKAVTVERGLDPRDFSLIAYGGAGPLHATAIARELHIQCVIIPRAPGHFSAFGMLLSDIRKDIVKTCFVRLSALDVAGLLSRYAEIEAEGEQAIRKTSAPAERYVIERAADMRYVGQEHALTVDLPLELFSCADLSGIKERFDAEHEKRYGHSAPDEDAEIVSVRSSINGVLNKPQLEHVSPGASEPDADALRTRRGVYFGGFSMFECPVYRRDALKAGNRIRGPAIIEEFASSTVLLPADQMEVDVFGNLVICCPTEKAS